MNTAPSLFGYYLDRGILPTFADLRGPEDLERHAAGRRALLEDRLNLPVRLFQGARVLEFGPDSGENALILAAWGATLTLVEPNPRAVDQIRRYFQAYGLEGRLEAVHPTDLAGYGRERAGDGTFDLVLADGFIFSVKPDRLWMDLFHRLLAPGGFALFCTHDPGGLFTDLLLKAVHARFRALTGLEPLAAARRLFQAKWDALPHTRSLEAWVMDQMENPFVRLAHCHDPARLARDLAGAGLGTWSAWPPAQGLQVHWHKHRPSLEERVEHEQRLHRLQALSYLVGRSLPCRRPFPPERLGRLLSRLDGLIDAYSLVSAAALGEDLEAAAAHLEREAAELRPGDLEQALAFLRCAGDLLRLMAAGDAPALEAFCAGDPVFIRSWGTPVHYRVVRPER